MREGTGEGRGLALWLALSLAAVAFCGMSCSKPPNAGSPAAAKGPDVILGSVQAGKHKVEFYADYDVDRDTAVLGFALKDEQGRTRYFPMYLSTSPDLDPVTLDVFLSNTREEMWVQSSWKGWEKLGYYRFGDERCMTPYGEMPSYATPIPPSVAAGSARFPPMEPARVQKALTMTHPPAH